MGTRPEIIKLAPLITLFKKNTIFIVRVVLTGQHLEMAEDILNLNDFADLASYELIDKEEGIFRKLDLEEDSVNQMIMEAREKIYS